MTAANAKAYKLKFLVRTHLRSYKWALRGLLTIFLQQLNFKLELIISLVVVAAAIFFKISYTQAVIIIFVIILVLVAEALNSALEAICDAVTVEKHQDIRYAKDVGAGAVLLAAIGSVLVGVIIFAPYVKNLLF